MIDCVAMSSMFEDTPDAAEPSPFHPDAGSAPAPQRPTGRAQLAPWQVRTAKAMMSAETNRVLPLSEIADRLGLSVNHFIKAFAKSVGMAPYHWFLCQRVAHSLEPLLEGELTIAKIAVECGFSDQSHFTRVFRRIVGTTPGRFVRGT